MWFLPPTLKQDTQFHAERFYKTLCLASARKISPKACKTGKVTLHACSEHDQDDAIFIYKSFTGSGLSIQNNREHRGYRLCFYGSESGSASRACLSRSDLLTNSVYCTVICASLYFEVPYPFSFVITNVFNQASKTLKST
jgi:hypothetical protein